MSKEGLTGELYGVSINHTYLIAPGTGSIKGRNRHACLQSGWWCWSNLREHPQDIVKYLKRKVRV